MTSHIGYSFECVCKYGFVGEYCEKGLYAFLIYYDSIDIDNVFLSFFLFLNSATPFQIFIQNKPTPPTYRGIAQGRIPRVHMTIPSPTE